MGFPYLRIANINNDQKNINKDVKMNKLEDSHLLKLNFRKLNIIKP
jgi:hypothetical protein